MSRLLSMIQKGFGKKLIRLHTWNAWLVALLAVTGLVLLGGFWREVLGEVRVWIRWVHIIGGLALLVPVIYYLFLASKHWKQIRQKPAQKMNVILVMILLIGWIVSGILLWLLRQVGPNIANTALFVHDLLTWIGLPYIIYHSLTRTAWLKDPKKRSIRLQPDHIASETVSSDSEPMVKKPVVIPAARPQEATPFYTRRSFLRGAIGIGLAVSVGPTFLRWLGNSLTSSGGSWTEMEASNPNKMVPDPKPLTDSSPPIGGGAQGEFRVYTVTPIPSFDNSNWSFTIDGLVNKPQTWNWEQFLSLKRHVQVSDFHCVTGWSVYKNTWEGIPLLDFLKMAGVKSEARTIKFYSGDGVYTDSITMEQAQLKDIMVAVLHDGNVIPADLGGPVRLVIPKMYAYKSVKWLNRIELIADDHTGYWEQRGYDKDAWLPDNLS
ncbi:molybdopterin-dependent oxidoreductase [Paenibacillus kandeliae]|uniref:molybdopterin-dependent oxidoreductase n=1 Tax=Paenibacillus kandeliae TaxID=3231269 RepID=UPI00345850DF